MPSLLHTYGDLSLIPRCYIKGREKTTRRNREVEEEEEEKEVKRKEEALSG